VTSQKQHVTGMRASHLTGVAHDELVGGHGAGWWLEERIAPDRVLR
jgi:hypothetical protein